jgi:beta-glucosidase
MSKKGGWKSKKIIDYFSRYTEKIVSSLKDDVKFWITINEPELCTYFSYLAGLWPPQEKNFFSFIKVIHNFIKVHREAYKIIKKIQPQAQVGIATNNTYYEAYKNRPISVLLKTIIERLDHFYILNRIQNYQDFIGLNYYFHCRIKGFKFNQNENKKISDIEWEIYPEGIYYVLKNLEKYKKPIYITENGLADAKDEKREWFIKETLKNVHKAIQEGIDVRGYFYWSLLDNFEWDKGFWPRFGLVEMDYKTLKRKIRPSAFKYGEICKNNAL